MKPLITAKDVEDLIKRGGKPSELPRDAIYTPSARDAIQDFERTSRVVQPGPSAPAPAASAGPASSGRGPKRNFIVPDYEYKWTPGSDPKTPEAVERFFNSPEIQILKERICDMGRRIWENQFVDGNGGNITIRVGDAMVLCTPTLISKGFMQPSDICLVDFDGNQLAGTRKRTSEVNTHIGIMKRQPKAKACVHAHPPHATAFAVASVVPPTCMIPEAEVFLGQIGFAEYRTPGSAENAQIVGEVGVDHQAVIMQNHGVIVWGKDVEDAYWKMENVDSYCKVVWIASQLGAPLKTISGGQMKELLGIRKSLGMDDPRANLKECQLCDNSDFRPGVMCSVPSGPAPAAGGVNTDAEDIVRQLTDMILAQTKNS